MNSDPDKLKHVPRWLRPLLGDTSEMELTEADLAEAAEIVRAGARAYRDSVVVPFVREKVRAALEVGGLLAAAGSANQRRFPVLLAEATEQGASYSPAGVADLLEGPNEDDEGGVLAIWEWIPEGGGAGCDGLVAAIMSDDSGEECGRGWLRHSENGWRITINQGRMDLLAGVTGNRHPIILMA